MRVCVCVVCVRARCGRVCVRARCGRVCVCMCARLRGIVCVCLFLVRMGVYKEPTLTHYVRNM